MKIGIIPIWTIGTLKGYRYYKTSYMKSIQEKFEHLKWNIIASYFPLLSLVWDHSELDTNYYTYN